VQKKKKAGSKSGTSMNRGKPEALAFLKGKLGKEAPVGLRAEIHTSIWSRADLKGESSPSKKIPKRDPLKPAAIV